MGIRRRAATATIALLATLLIVSCGHDDMGPMMGREGNPPDTTLAPTSTPGGDATVSYSEDIQPIFSENCTSCHGGSGGLWLDSYERVLAGSSRGAVVEPGDPGESELYLRVTGESEPRMPLNSSPLSDDDIDAIRTWISEGAPNN